MSWIRLLKDSFAYLIFTLVIVLGFFGLYFVDTYLRVEEVELNQTGGKTVEVVGLSAPRGRNMLFLDTKKLEKEMQSQNPAVKSIHIEKEYPSRLLVNVSTREAVVALQGDVGYFQLAADGTILSKEREEPRGLPKIQYYQKPLFINFQAGEKLDYTDIIMAIRYFDKFEYIGLKPKTIIISDFSDIAFVFSDKTEIHVTAEKPPDDQWYQIEKLLKELQMQGIKYILIDVRFEKPYYEVQK